jgi:hypothetical protein
VIELGSAGGGVEDSTGVLLEGSSVGLDGDGGWSLGNGSLEGIDGSSLDGVDSLGVDLTLGGLILAGSISGGVWVGRLELLSVGGNVLHGVGLPSTIASVGGGVAVDDLLLGEGEEASGLDEVVSLNGGSGGEGPA